MANWYGSRAKYTSQRSSYRVIGAQPILLKMAVSDVVTAATFDEVHMAAQLGARCLSN
jgi:hypothetical protein